MKKNLSSFRKASSILALLISANNLQAANFIFNVSDTTTLNAAIVAANGKVAGDTVTFNFTSGITLGSQLNAVDLSGANLIINGNGFTLDGDNSLDGLRLLDGTIAVNNLTIANAVATGGVGGNGGGGGAGMGGGIFVGSSAFVNLSGVGFSNNSAVGGNGGAGAIALIGGGGGGGASVGGDPDGTNGTNNGVTGGNGGMGGGTNGGAGGVGGIGIVANGAPGGLGGGGGGGTLGLALGGGGGGKGGYGGGGGGGGGVGVALVSTGSGGDGGYGGGAGGSGIGLLPGILLGSGGTAGFGGGNAGAGVLLSLGGTGGGGAALGGNIFVQDGGHLTFSGSSTMENGSVSKGLGGGNGATDGVELGTGVFLAGNGILTFGAVTDSTGSTQTIQGGIDDEFGVQGSTNKWDLLKTGPGTLIIEAATNYHGVTTVEGGVFQVGNGGTTGSIVGDVALANGSGLVFDRSDDLTYAGSISGDGTVTKEGAGILTLSGTNSYTGDTNVNTGTLQAGSLGAFGATSAFTVDTGATLDLNDFSQTVGSISGDGTIDLGSATLTSGGNNDPTTFSGVITGSGGIVKEGSGTLTLTGANNYTGGTTVNGGTLAGNTTGIQGDVVTLAGTTVEFDQAVDGTYSGQLSGDGALVKEGAGTLVLAGTNTHTGGTTVNDGTLQVGDGATSGSLTGDIALNNGAGLVFDRTDPTSFAGDISGDGSLTKNGTGTLTLSGANTYTGDTNINAGVLQAGAAGALSADSAITVATGATLDLNGFDQSIGSLAGTGTVDLGTATLTLGIDNTDTTFAGIITGAGDLVKEGTGTLTLSGANDYTGGTTVNDGTLQIGDGATSGSITGDISLNNGAALVFDRTDPTSFAGDISGDGSLTKNGTGTLTLSGANTYTGDTTVNAGVLQVGAAGALSADSAITVATGATLDLNDFDQSIGSLAGSGTVDLGLATLTLGIDNTDTEFSGIITGAGDLVKEGTGTLTLSGANDFTGGTTISDGTLALVGAGTLAPTGDVVVDGTFDISGITPVGLTIGDLSGSGSVDLGAKTLTLGTAGDSTFSGDITGSGGLVKEGTGTLTLSGASDFSGGIAVDGGIVQVGDDAALGTGLATVNTGGTLDVAGHSVTNAITLNGTGDNGIGALINSGAAVTLGPVTLGSDTTIGTGDIALGDITGAFVLTKINTGTLTLNGANNAATAVNVDGGIVQVGDDAALGTGLATVNTGGTLDVAGHSVTNAITLNGTGDNGIGALINSGAAVTLGPVTLGSDTTIGTGDIALGDITGAFVLTKIDTGTLALNGANNDATAVNVDGGIVQVGDDAALGTGLATVNTGGTLDVAGHSVTNAITLNGTGDNGIGALINSGAAVTLGPVTLGSDTTIGTGDIALGDITGAFVLTKIDTGTLTLNGANNAATAVNVDGGIVQVGDDAALGSGLATVNTGGTLDVAGHSVTNAITLNGTGDNGIGALINSGAAVTLGPVTLGSDTTIGEGDIALGDITGAFVLTKIDTGTLTLNGANNAATAVNVDGGTVQVGDDAALGTGLATVNAGGTLDVAGHSVTNAITLNGTGDNGIGALINSGAAVTLGPVTLGSDTTVGTGDIALGDITGAFVLTKIDTGTLTLNGANNAATAVNVDGGIVQVGDDAALGSGLTTVNTDGTLDVAGHSVTNAITLNGTGDNGIGALINSGAAVTLGPVTLGSDTTIGVGDITLGDITGGAVSLTKIGTGTLTLDGNGGYTGDTTVVEGTLKFTTRDSFYAGVVDTTTAAKLTVESGATAVLNVSDPVSPYFDQTDITTILNDGDFQAGAIIGLDTTHAIGGNFTYADDIGVPSSSIGLAKLGTGMLTLTGENTFTGGTTVEAGTLRIGDGGATGSIVGDIVNNAAVVFDRTGVVDYTGTMSGTGTLTKLGDGTLTLTGANTYTGGTTIRGGTLVADNATALGGPGPGNIVDVDGATLRVTAGTDVVGIDTLILQNNAVWEGDGSLSAALFDVRWGVSTVALTGTGEMVKTTADTVTLSGQSDYTGTTTVAAGMLQFTKAVSFYNNQVAANAAKLTVESGATAAFNVGGADGFTEADVGALLGASNGTVGFKTGATIGIDTTNGDFDYTTGISNPTGSTSLGLTKLGDGKLVLSGTNDYTGTTTVEKGTLDFSGATDVGDVIVKSGATLVGQGSFASLTNFGRVAPGHSPGTITLAGDFNNSGILDIEIQGTAPGQFDLIQYAGVAHILPGSTLNILHLAGYVPAAGDVVQFLFDTDSSSGPPVTGTFDTTNLPVLSPELTSAIVVNGTGMAYVVVYSTFVTPGGGLSFRPHDGLEQYAAIVSGNVPAYTQLAAVGVLQSQAALTQAVTNASPIGFSAMDALVIDENRSTAKFLMDRARAEAGAHPSNDDLWTAFVDMHGVTAQWDQDLYTGGTFNHDFFGGKAGLNYSATEDISVGVALGYDKGNAQFHDSAGSVRQDRATVTGYITSTVYEKAFVYCAVIGGVSGYETERYNLLGRERGDAQGTDIAFTTGVGYKFQVGESFDITPYAGLTYTVVQVDEFSENGTALAVKMDERHTESVRARVGGDIGWTMPVDMGSLRFSLGLAFEHEMLANDASMRASFLNGSGSFNFTGDTLSRNSVTVSPGVAWNFTPTQSVGFGYSYEHGFSNTESHRFDASYSVRF